MKGDGDKANQVKAALFNEVILYRIYILLPFQDQKTFHRVCKKWRNCLLGNWRKNVVFCLGNDHRFREEKRLGFQDFFDVFSSSDDSNFQKFDKIPFRRYRIYQSRLWLPPEFENEAGDTYRSQVQKVLFFWRSCGPFMEYLDIQDCSILTVNPETKVLTEVLKWILLENCINLRELKIANLHAQLVPIHRNIIPVTQPEVEDKQQNVYRYNLIPLNENRSLRSLAVSGETLLLGFLGDAQSDLGLAMEILRLIPNVQELRLDEACAQVFCPALKQKNASLITGKRYGDAENCSSNATYTKLNALELHGGKGITRIFPNLREYLSTAKPEIRKLHLGVDKSPSNIVPPYDFHHFISDCSRTLTYLQLETIDSSFEPSWFTCLNGQGFFPKLKHLSLKIAGRGVIKFDFSCLRLMPMLKSFRCEMFFPCSLLREELRLIETDIKIEESGDETTAFCLENLEEFWFGGVILTKDVLTKLSKLMPRIRSLKCTLNGEFCTDLLNCWPNLRKLVFLQGSDSSAVDIMRKCRNNNGDIVILEDTRS